MIRIPLKKYFPFQINLVAILLIVAGVLVGLESIWLAITLLTIGLIIFTAAYKISIDPVRQTFREYLFFAGFKIGKAKKYNRLENIIISSHQFNQTINSRTSTRTIRTIVYRGFVQFNDHDKVLIAENQLKKKVINKLKKVSRAFNLQISDYTD